MFISLSHAEQVDFDHLTSLNIEDLLQVDIESASLFTQKLIEAPAAVTVITSEEINNRAYRTLGEALDSFRGMYVQNQQNHSYIGTRGFSPPSDYNTRLLFMIDASYDSVRLAHKLK